MQPSKRSIRTIAGRPVGANSRELGNPWRDAESDERLLAAAFADRVVYFTCLAIGLVLLTEFVAPEFASWLVGMVTR